MVAGDFVANLKNTITLLIKLHDIINSQGIKELIVVHGKVVLLENLIRIDDSYVCNARIIGENFTAEGRAVVNIHVLKHLLFTNNSEENYDMLGSKSDLLDIIRKGAVNIAPQLHRIKPKPQDKESILKCIKESINPLKLHELIGYVHAEGNYVVIGEKKPEFDIKSIKQDYIGDIIVEVFLVKIPAKDQYTANEVINKLRKEHEEVEKINLRKEIEKLKKMYGINKDPSNSFA